MIEEAKNTDAAREDIAGLLDQNYDAYTKWRFTKHETDHDTPLPAGCTDR